MITTGILGTDQSVLGNIVMGQIPVSNVVVIPTTPSTAVAPSQTLGYWCAAPKTTTPKTRNITAQITHMKEVRGGWVPAITVCNYHLV